ncbi:MAG TPA: hypothetical protein VG860_05800 [Terriglobia bacterium]|jgi:DNA polymerase III delta prime subunit|nr:hypothetical protein [Terriglobia bacterium]
MKAPYLGKVIEYFNPMQSLNESLRDWYVDRPDNPHEEIKVLVLNDPTPLKILFSGHIGSGKSSALNCLTRDPEIKGAFFIVQFSVERDLNIFDLTYSDLLLAIGKRLFEEADRAGLDLEAKLLTDLEKWTAEVSVVKKKEEGADVAVKAKISAWFLSAVGTLKTGYSENKEFRQKFEPRVPELITFINRIIHAIQTHPQGGDKRVLMVIEDLDKPPVDVSMDLFMTKGPVLVQPECKIIFTVPTSVLYSGQIKVVQQNFPMQYVLPNFKIKDQAGERSEVAWNCMRDIVLRRMDAQLIDSGALDYAVEMSGGVTRELIRIIQAAALRAVVTKANSIQRSHVDHAVVKFRGEYNNQLTRQESVEILREVHKTRQLRSKDEKPMLDLMHNLMILQYPNGPGWYEVNPIVRQLIGV